MNKDQRIGFIIFILGLLFFLFPLFSYVSDFFMVSKLFGLGFFGLAEGNDQLVGGVKPVLEVILDNIFSLHFMFFLLIYLVAIIFIGLLFLQIYLGSNLFLRLIGVLFFIDGLRNFFSLRGDFKFEILVLVIIYLIWGILFLFTPYVKAFVQYRFSLQQKYNRLNR